MKIKVNGEDMTNISGSVQDLLLYHNLRPERVAVEYNGQILPRSAFAQTTLQDGDCLEIVQFVGGG